MKLLKGLNEKVHIKYLAECSEYKQHSTNGRWHYLYAPGTLLSSLFWPASSGLQAASFWTPVSRSFHICLFPMLDQYCLV